MPDQTGQNSYLIATGFFVPIVSRRLLLSASTPPAPAMALQCAASANLVLPRVLRSVFCSELPHDLRISPVRRYICLPSKGQHARPFSLATRFHQLQVGQLHDVTTEPRPHTTKPSPEPKPEYTGSAASAHESAIVSLTESPEEIRESSKKSKDRKATDKDKKLEPAKKTLKKKTKKKPEGWQIQKGALEKKFPAGWNPPKKLSPDALEGIRHLHATAPDRFTTAVLAEEFKVSPEAIRRILKSRWKPSEDEMESRRQRWERRHERIWSQMVELGLRPPSPSSKPLLDSNSLYRKDKK